MEFHRFELNVGNETQIFETGKMARQADGAVTLTVGKSVLLATVVCDDDPVEEDFLPLTVQYIEKTYAAGKFPGGFIKRETKPGEFATLTARIVDRSLRPLFPKGFNYPVVITITVLSCGEDADLQRLALSAASAALYVSPLPVNKAVAAARIGRNGEGLTVNPTHPELEEGTLDLFVAGTAEELLMIEMKASGKEEAELLEPMVADPLMEPVITPQMIETETGGELDEATLIDALKTAGDQINATAALYADAFAPAKKPEAEYVLAAELADETIYDFIKANYHANVKAAINQMAKSERSGALKLIRKEIMATPHAIDNEWDEDVVKEMLAKVKKELVREQILNEKLRADGRKLDEVRPIDIETNLLPAAHASCLFTRGQTQALAVLTLGGDSDRQAQEFLTDKNTKYENFMLHYNFPGYSVGEAKPERAPGRRELGHGNLAKRAIEGMIPSGFDHTIRIVSEILESNGSSSMATVCAGSLALKGAGVPLKKLVAGVAMGLVTEGNDYAILTDIMGLEDANGDMDFKVAGTRDGITALQMDIKLGGISYEILGEALEQAKAGRMHILSIMEEAEAKIQVNEGVLPHVEIFTVNPDRIVDIIGRAGSTIKEIIEKFQVNIDLDREKGGVKIHGPEKENVLGAVEHVKGIASGPGGGKGGGRGGDRPQKKSNTKVEYNPGDVINGKVFRVMNYGILVSLPDGNMGMCHVSEMGAGRRIDVTRFFEENEEVEVVFKEQGDDLKISLGLKTPLS